MSKQEKEPPPQKKKKKIFTDYLLQSTGVVKHSPLNSQVALTTDHELL